MRVRIGGDPSFPPCFRGSGGSDVEEDVEDVAVGDFVVFAVGLEEGAFLGFGFGAAVEQVVPADDLGADESAFEVAVDAAGGALGVGPGGDGPGAAFVFADGEKAAQTEDAEGFAEGGFDGAGGRAGAQLFAVGGGFVGIELAQLFLQPGAERGQSGVLAQVAAVAEDGRFRRAGVVFAEVDQGQEGSFGEESVVAQAGAFVVVEGGVEQVAAIAEVGLESGEEVDFAVDGDALGGFGGLGFESDPLEAFFRSGRGRRR